MNKNAALQFLQKGKKRMESRDYVSATHLLTKAKRLDPDLVPEVNSLMALIPKSQPTRPQSTPPRSTPSTSSSRGKTSKSRKSNEKEEEEEEEDKKKCTAEEEKVVKSTLLKGKDYYEILGISKESTQKEIKSAYRKKAMKVHPDRNPHSLATEAFKRVGEAFVCLSDPSKREFYDRHGIDPENKAEVHNHSYGPSFTSNSPRRRGHHHPHQQFVFGDRDDDFFFHLFSQMFAGGDFEDVVHFPRRGAQMRRRRRRRTGQPGHRAYVEQNEFLETAIRRLVTFILIAFLILFFFNWFSKLLIPPSPSDSTNTPYMNKYKKYYRFEKSPLYSRRMHCSYARDISYFVKRDFQMNWKTTIDQVVYKHYKNHLMDKCKKEQAKYQNILKKAKNERNRNRRDDLRKMAKKLKEKKSCILHDQIYKNSG